MKTHTAKVNKYSLLITEYTLIGIMMNGAKARGAVSSEVRRPNAFAHPLCDTPTEHVGRFLIHIKTHTGNQSNQKVKGHHPSSALCLLPLLNELSQHLITDHTLLLKSIHTNHQSAVNQLSISSQPGVNYANPPPACGFLTFVFPGTTLAIRSQRSAVPLGNCCRASSSSFC